MAERHGQAFWPGARGCVSCTYTVGHGITPGLAALTVPEQDPGRILPTGDLVITDGVGTLRVKRCKLVSISFSSAGGPRTMTLHIADRRWMWAFGRVDGNWNQIDPYPDPDALPDGEFRAAGGPYMPGTYRTAARMLGDCLGAMGEGNFLIDPSPAYPVPARWAAEVPAQALAGLAEQIGYRVVYQPGFDRVVVCPLGAGVALPVAPAIAETASLKYSERPNALRLVGGDTLFHDLLMLEPVGLEKNGQFKPINDLSYKPRGGWYDAAVPPFFGEVPAGTDLTQQEANALARQHVWRTFRPMLIDVQSTKQGAINVGGYGKVYDRKQLELGDRAYGLAKDASGQLTSEPAWCVGTVYVANDTQAKPIDNTYMGHTTAASGRLPFPFTVDGARGLVTFSRYMFRKVGEAGSVSLYPPDLYLYTGFKIRSRAGLVPVRFEAAGPTGSLSDAGCPPEIVRRPDLVEVVVCRRNFTDGFGVTEVTGNRADALAAADYYLRAANRRYEVEPTQSKTYAGILPLDPDGAITEVTYSVGGGAPATTQATRNGEHAYYVPPYAERRRNETARTIEAEFAAAKARNVWGRASGAGQGGASVGGAAITLPES